MESFTSSFSLLFFFSSVLPGVADRGNHVEVVEYNQGTKDERHIPARPRLPDSAVPVEFYEAKPNCNPHNYAYMINQPNLCKENREILLVVLIRSIFSHYDRRMAMRETWAMQESFSNYTVKFAFLFAAQSDDQVQNSILRESQMYDDVIQEDFGESYSNLTLKTVMAWKWAKTYCPNAYYVMVCDDAIIVDIFKLVNYLTSEVETNYFRNEVVLCYLFPCCTRAIHARSKYAVSEKIYPGSAYPAYCSGNGYIATSKTIKKFYTMSLDTPSFMPDDAWMGVIAEKLGVAFLDTYTSYIGISKRDSLLPAFLHPSYLTSPLMVAVLDYHYAGKEPTMMRSIWNTIKKQREEYKDKDKIPFSAETADSLEDQTNNIWIFAVFLISVDMALLIFLFIKVFRKKNWPWF